MSKVRMEEGKLVVPSNVTIPFIELIKMNAL